MTAHCYQAGNLVVCREEMREVKREPDGEPRWCFHERKITEFEFVVIAPVGPSYYSAIPTVRCRSCNQMDADLFPGRSREWDED